MLKFENSIYDIVEDKTDIKGFWLDNGKLFIDNVKIYHPLNSNDFESKLYLMFAQGERAVFVRGKDKAFIIYPQGETVVLSKMYAVKVSRLSFNEIKNLLNENNGLTIYKENDGYTLEYWKE